MYTLVYLSIIIMYIYFFIISMCTYTYTHTHVYSIMYTSIPYKILHLIIILMSW